MRIGLIGRDDNKGLGRLTRELCRWLPIAKVLLKRGLKVAGSEGGLPQDKLTQCINPDDVADRWIRDIDTLLVLEFAAHPKIWETVRQRGIYSALKVNYEYLPTELAVGPDLYLCSSSVNLAAVPDDKHKLLLPDPVDTERIPFEQRRTARVFVHNAGTLGAAGANCTREVLQAIPLVRNRDVRFIVRSQVRLPPHAADVRTTYQGAVPGVEQLYGLGDVFLLPQKFRATSLPIQEAMAAGMPVLTTDMPPFNEFCQFLIPSRGVSSLRGQFMKRDVLSHQVEPQAIANAIDHLAGQDISEASRAARRYAESIGWQVLAPRWLAACNGSLPGIRQRD